MRISGLATGMDTESIIRDMMKAQRIPLDKITQKKQYLEWQLDDYRSINRNLKTQSDKLFDTVMKQGSYLAKTVNVSNTDAVNIKALNATSEFAGTIAVHQLATQATLQSGKITKEDGTTKMTDAEFAATTVGTASSITIKAPGKDEVTLTFESTDTMKTVLDRINKETGVSAFYDAHTGKIAMTAKNSGEGDIEVSGDLSDKLKLSGVGGTSGENAEFTFNGLTTQRSSNTFQINGFEINLKQVTGPPEAPTVGAVTFSSAPDTDKIVDSVVQFVNDYNTLIEELNAKIREPKYRGFPPLSDEQKKDMKENEIKLWEEKAKSATLRNDPTITNMLTKLRTIMSSQVGPEGSKMSLADLGITQSKDFMANGKLLIDEDKLRTAIADDPNKVYELIGKSSGVKGENGIAAQYRKVLIDSQASITKKAGSASSTNEAFTLGRTLKDMNSQITRFEDRLKMTEDRLWKQFSAMEKAIQRMNAQSAQLMSSLGGGM